MDRRIERTRNSIKDAFLELRSKRDIEKISVKELCERANINKSTFYTHYQDIYELSEQLEKQVACDILKEVGHPEYIFTHPDIFTRELYYAYLGQGNLINIIFSGSRYGMLIVRIEASLKEALYEVYPGFKDNARVNVLFTLEIYGQFYAFMQCRHFGDDVVIDILCRHWEKSVEQLREAGFDIVN